MSKAEILISDILVHDKDRCNKQAIKITIEGVMNGNESTFGPTREWMLNELTSRYMGSAIKVDLKEARIAKIKLQIKELKDELENLTNISNK